MIDELWINRTNHNNLIEILQRARPIDNIIRLWGKLCIRMYKIYKLTIIQDAICVYLLNFTLDFRTKLRYHIPNVKNLHKCRRRHGYEYTDGTVDEETLKKIKQLLYANYDRYPTEGDSIAITKTAHAIERPSLMTPSTTVDENVRIIIHDRRSNQQRMYDGEGRDVYSVLNVMFQIMKTNECEIFNLNPFDDELYLSEMNSSEIGKRRIAAMKTFYQ